MAYIATKRNEIGDWVLTKKRHESMAGVFTKGSKVKIIDIATYSNRGFKY